MGRFEDLTGQRFGKLVVVDRNFSHTGKVKWNCVCDCGNTCVCTSVNLKSGNSKSCGCGRSVVAKKKLHDLSGQTFGRWTVLYRDVSKSNSNAYWFCQCQCGVVKSVNSGNLVSGKSISCGCYRAENPSNFYDLIGQRFGKLLVVRRADYQKDSYAMWFCKCDCGNTVTVRSSSLLKGDTKSCGCYHKKYVSDLLTKNLVGMTFGHLTVVSRDYSKQGHAYWNCNCSCGNVVSGVDGYNLTHGLSTSCGCINSKLETFLIQIFNDISCVYKTQLKFDDLTGIGNGKLSYDFGLFDESNNLICLIECQGEQHYKPIEHFGGESQFEVQQFHDDLKREYANDYLQVPLIEIPYTISTYDKMKEFFEEHIVPIMNDNQ